MFNKLFFKVDFLHLCNVILRRVIFLDWSKYDKEINEEDKINVLSEIFENIKKFFRSFILFLYLYISINKYKSYEKKL